MKLLGISAQFSFLFPVGAGLLLLLLFLRLVIL